MQTPPRHFPRRVQRNGTMDSICLRCFRTVASSKDAALLLIEEAQHQCEPDSAAYRQPSALRALGVRHW